MRALVVGGAGSGKSAFAEGLACRLSPMRTYLATMLPEGDEAHARIERHRACRSGKGFVTLERPRLLLPLDAPKRMARGVVLLDDLGNLVANALFLPSGAMRDRATVQARLELELEALADAYAHVVVVGIEAGGEGVPPHDATLAWLRVQGALCCHAASLFDVVVEVTAGVPHVLKGELP